MRTINFHHPQMARSFERVCVCWFREIFEVIVNFVSLFLILNDDLATFLECFWVLQSTTFGIPFSNWLPPFRLILWFNEYSFYDIHLAISIFGSFSPFGIETCSLKCQIAWKREREIEIITCKKGQHADIFSHHKYLPHWLANARNKQNQSFYTISSFVWSMFFVK